VEDSGFGDGRRLAPERLRIPCPQSPGAVPGPPVFQMEISVSRPPAWPAVSTAAPLPSARVVAVVVVLPRPTLARSRRARAAQRLPRRALTGSPPRDERAPFEGLCALSRGISPKFPFHTPFSRRRRTYALCQNSTQQAQTTMSRSAHLRLFGGSSGAAPRPREPPQRAQGLHPRPVGGFRPEFCLRKIFGPPNGAALCCGGQRFWGRAEHFPRETAYSVPTDPWSSRKRVSAVPGPPNFPNGNFCLTSASMARC